jgi:hypothetical protein
VLSPEIEDRDKVEVGNWVKYKKTFYSEYLQADHKNNRIDLFSFAAFIVK